MPHAVEERQFDPGYRCGGRPTAADGAYDIAGAVDDQGGHTDIAQPLGAVTRGQHRNGLAQHALRIVDSVVGPPGDLGDRHP